MLVKTAILGTIFILTSLTNNHLDVLHAKKCITPELHETAHNMMENGSELVPATIFLGDIIPSIMLNEVVIKPEMEGTIVKADRIGDAFIPSVMLEPVTITATI